MMRVAAFDCGTNTIKLLVATLDQGTGEAIELVRDLRMVRLGQDVDRTGKLSEEALARVFAAIDEFKAVIGAYDVDVMRFCATSAVRDADNAEVFASGVRQRLDIGPDILTGDEEARLTYDGATRSLPDLPHPILVPDIGGGSTELIIDDRHRSLDIGSVRLTERCFLSDPPTPHQVEEAATLIDRQLDTLAGTGMFLDLAKSMVGVAGTITTMTAMAHDLPSYDRSAIHHARVGRDGIHEVTARLLGMSVAERKALPYMHPGRADVIAAGALILDRIMHRTTVGSMLVSDADILDGIAWSVV